MSDAIGGLTCYVNWKCLDILYFRLTHNILLLVLFCYMRNARQAHALQLEFC